MRSLKVLFLVFPCSSTKICTLPPKPPPKNLLQTASGPEAEDCGLLKSLTVSRLDRFEKPFSGALGLQPLNSKIERRIRISARCGLLLFVS